MSMKMAGEMWVTVPNCGLAVDQVEKLIVEVAPLEIESRFGGKVNCRVTRTGEHGFHLLVASAQEELCFDAEVRVTPTNSLATICPHRPVSQLDQNQIHYLILRTALFRLLRGRSAA